MIIIKIKTWKDYKNDFIEWAKAARRKTCNDNSEQVHSEIHCLPIVDGISTLIKESLNNKNFNFDEFIKDATDIQEIRGLLPKIFGDGSKPKTSIYIFLHR